jgi:hypothetical protein
MSALEPILLGGERAGEASRVERRRGRRRAGGHGLKIYRMDAVDVSPLVCGILNRPP